MKCGQTTAFLILKVKTFSTYRILKHLLHTVSHYRVLCVLLFAILVQNCQATVYYTRKVSAYWANPATWSTAGFGGVAGSTTPGANDTVRVGDGNVLYININATIKMLEVGQLVAARLEFYSGGIVNLTVTGDVTVNTFSILNYNSNSGRTHTMHIGGSLTNNGLIDFYRDVNDKVDLDFNGSSNSIVSGSGTWVLYNVSTGKSEESVTVDVQVSAFETAINTLTFTGGTYIHNNSGSYSVNSTGTAAFTIPDSAALQVPQGTVRLSPANDIAYLGGSLYVNGGTVIIGTSAGNDGLRYDQTGTTVPYLEVSSGQLTVYGGITYTSGSASDPFSFRMTGGTVLLNSGSGGTRDELLKVNDVAGSSFYMSAGTITMQDHNDSPGNNCADFDICGTNGTVVSLGGTIEFGNASTPAGTVFDFMPRPGVTQPNFKVTGPEANAITLAAAKSTIDNFQLLSLYIDTNKTFDIQSIQGVPGDSKIMTLMSSFDGAYGFYSRGTFNARTSTVEMGSAEAQAIGGTVSETFYNLTISNNAYVTLEKTEYVSNLLTMTLGNLVTTSTKIITCTSTGNATIGSAVSFVDGPMLHQVAATSAIRIFPVGTGSTYRPAILDVTHTNSTEVGYSGELFNTPATSLGYTLPPTIDHVSGMRYWNFTRQSIANLVGATMTLYYDTDDSVTDLNNVRVVHDNGSGAWVDYGGSGSANIAGSISSNAVALFNSKFGLGFPPNTLPIELVSFYVKPDGNRVDCHWYTASEINNDFFTIERSPDGIHFEPAGTVEGAGNSHLILHYSFTDPAPIVVRSFYRLKQTDFDGRFTYSDIRSVTIEAEAAYAIYPNPAIGNRLFIRGEDATMKNAEVFVQDMNGRKVPVDDNREQDGEIRLLIDSAHSAHNEYFIVSVQTGNDITRKKILIENQ